MRPRLVVDHALEDLADRLRERLLADATDDAGAGAALALRERIRGLVDREAGLLDAATRAELVARIERRSFGLGPLDALLGDPTVDEVMVNGAGSVWVERGGRLEPTDVAFADEGALRHAIERILAPLGRRVDEAEPLCDARLPDRTRRVRRLPDRSSVAGRRVLPQRSSHFMVRKGASVRVRQRACRISPLPRGFAFSGRDCRGRRRLLWGVWGAHSSRRQRYRPAPPRGRAADCCTSLSSAPEDRTQLRKQQFGERVPHLAADVGSISRESVGRRRRRDKRRQVRRRPAASLMSSLMSRSSCGRRTWATRGADLVP